MGIGKDIARGAGSEAAAIAGEAAKETVQVAGHEAQEALDRLHGNVVGSLELLETLLRRNKIVASWKFPFRLEIEIIPKG